MTEHHTAGHGLPFDTRTATKADIEAVGPATLACMGCKQTLPAQHIWSIHTYKGHRKLYCHRCRERWLRQEARR